MVFIFLAGAQTPKKKVLSACVSLFFLFGQLLFVKIFCVCPQHVLRVPEAQTALSRCCPSSLRSASTGPNKKKQKPGEKKRSTNPKCSKKSSHQKAYALRKPASQKGAIVFLSRPVIVGRASALLLFPLVQRETGKTRGHCSDLTDGRGFTSPKRCHVFLPAQ
jgi:hypothetical protein